MNIPTKKIFNLFATTPKGLELLLVDELKKLGAIDPREKLAGVTFSGDLEVAYKSCLWSRLANRILLALAKFPAATPEALYASVKNINWSEHLSPQASLAVHFVSNQSAISHTLFGAQKVKDAIVDQFKEKFGIRPDVSRNCPDVSIYVYLHKDVAEISLDLSGESLHKRGYRLVSGSAPLKENLAAAILLRANWPAIARVKGSLYDPMCGSGTLLIEAALLAADIAPGLEREYFGFIGWKQHQANLWQTLINEAVARRKQGLQNLPMIVGFDHDPISVKIAFENIERAGLQGKIHVEKRELTEFAPTQKAKTGLIVVNPPYGERLGDSHNLQNLYRLLAERLKQHFVGWNAAIFTGNPELSKQMGLRAKRQYALFNGTIACKLLLFDIQAEFFIDQSPAAVNERLIRKAKHSINELDKEAVQMFVNRLHKNIKKIKSKLEENHQTTYRLYDADIPEYAFSIDIEGDLVKVQEYQAPNFVQEEKVIHRRYAVLSILPELLEVEPAKIFFSITAKT